MSRGAEARQPLSVEEVGERPAGKCEYTIRLKVRRYEVDSFGHVNNAVYLNWMEQCAVEHADSLGLTVERMRELGGVFIVRHHDVTYHRPAQAGDELDVTTRITSLGKVRAVRENTIRHAHTGELLVEGRTEWAWIRWSDLRPAPIPREVHETFPEE